MKLIIFLQALEPHRLFRLVFSAISWTGDGPLYVLLFPLLYWQKSPAIAIRYGYLWGFTAVVMTGLKQQAGTLRPFLAAPEQVAFLKYSLEGVYWFPDRQALIEAYHQSSSFPSGHALFAAALGMYLFTHTKSVGLRGLLIFFVLLIPVTRLYLGVHYPTDVLAGSGIGLVLWWLVTGISWHSLATRLSCRGWRRGYRQLLLVVLLGGVLSAVSMQAFFVLLLLLPYPVMLTLAERPIHRFAERGGAHKTLNAIGGCCGTGIIVVVTAPLLSVGSLVSVPLVTAWVTMGCPLLVEKTANVMRTLRL